MKSYVFPYYISFGKLDSVDDAIECALSDKDAKRLERSAKEGGRFRLNEDEKIREIYNRIYDAIVSSEKKKLLQDPTIIRNAFSWDEDYDPEKEILKEQIESFMYNVEIGINYPTDLQYLEKAEKKKISQSRCKSVKIERDFTQKYLMAPGNKNTIIYVDGGKTLFYIPKEYSGKFVLPTGVTKVEKNVFQKHKKIKEIIIENGIQELPDSAFEGCTSLIKITIPASVKKIGFNTFMDCKNLKEVVLAEGLNEIDNTAFRYCSSLEVLRLPSTVKLINKHISSYFNSIKHIYFVGMETTVDDKMGGDWRGITLHVKAGSCAEQYARENDVDFIIETYCQKKIANHSIPVKRSPQRRGRT